MEMVEQCHPSYDFYQLFFANGDTGHAGSARDRTYVIGSHTEKSSCYFDPLDCKQLITRYICKKVQTVPSDYFIAQQHEVQLEAEQLARRRKIRFKPKALDLSYLLTKEELKRLRAYERIFGQDPRLDPNLVVFLSDNPDSGWKTWSASSGRIPTFRRNVKTGLLWSPCYSRFMVAKEKLAATGWPVTSNMAAAMGCDPIPAADVMRAADLAGNAMHFTTVAAAQLVALCCFRPVC